MFDVAANGPAPPGLAYHEIATNHMIPNNRPQELADILAKLGLTLAGAPKKGRTNAGPGRQRLR